MSTEVRDEIVVWTDGEEGRFLKWGGEAWQAFEHRNYRHSFSPPQVVTQADLRALRQSYRVSAETLSDQDLVRTSPRSLMELSGVK
jgi:hypothetical protein